MTKLQRFGLIVIFMSIIFHGCSAFPVSQSSTVHEPTIQQMHPSPGTTQVAVTITEAPLSNPPKPDTVYSGQINGQKVLFYSSTRDFQKHYEKHSSSAEFYGEVYCGGYELSLQHNLSAFEFNDLDNARLLLTIGENGQSTIGTIDSVICRADETFLEISLWLENYIYRVDFQAGNTHLLYKSPTPINLEDEESGMLVITHYSCLDYYCAHPHTTTILNTLTQAQKDLGAVGDIFIINDRVAFRKLAQLDVPCDPNAPHCYENGTFAAFFPVGEFFTESLP